MKVLAFLFWSAVTLGGFGYLCHVLSVPLLASPFILFFAVLFTAAGARSSAE
jgi:hypothetical protein